ncbi:MAG: hypothetical protein ACK4ON_01955 [Bacteroidia bacterium]
MGSAYIKLLANFFSFRQLSILEINKKIPLPDFTFILKVSPEICLKRISSRAKEIEFFEEEEKLKKVLDVYLKLPEIFNNLYIINGERKIETIHQEIVEILKI